LSAGLSRGCQPRVGLSPEAALARGVAQNHREEGKKEAQKPQQRARVTEAEIEVSKGGQQERRQEQGRSVIVIGHGGGECRSHQRKSTDCSMLADPSPVLAFKDHRWRNGTPAHRAMTGRSEARLRPSQCNVYASKVAGGYEFWRTDSRFPETPAGIA